MRYLAALLVLVVLGMAGCSSSPTAIATWKPPVEGSTPVTYVVQKKVGLKWANVKGKFIGPTRFSFEVSEGDTLVIRVAAVDGLDRRGDWSRESMPYVVR